jgi:hypothetical protein
VACRPRKGADACQGRGATLASGSGSQVGSHWRWIAADGCGRRWTRKPLVPGCVDGCGHLWTPLGDLRIRRLGVRVPPGVPRNPLRCNGFQSTPLSVPSDVLGAILVERGVGFVTQLGSTNRTRSLSHAAVQISSTSPEAMASMARCRISRECVDFRFEGGSPNPAQPTSHRPTGECRPKARERLTRHYQHTIHIEAVSRFKSQTVPGTSSHDPNPPTGHTQ